MSEHYLRAADDQDYAIASDLGRKAGFDVTSTILRAMSLGDTAYQREVICLAAAVSAIVCARIALQKGSAPDATDQDVIEALVDMLKATTPEDGGREDGPVSI